MAVHFQRTLRSLGEEPSLAPRLGLLAAVLLLGGWLVWSLTSEVTLYETTRAGRLEVAHRAQEVRAPLDGVLSKLHVKLGSKVAPGDLLFELDATRLTLERAEEQARLESIQAQLPRLEAQLAREQELGTEAARAEAIGLDSARAQQRATEARTQLAEAEAKSSQALHEKGLTAELDARRLQVEARAQQSSLEEQQLLVERLKRQQRVGQLERETRVEELRREFVRMQGELRHSEATLARLTHEIERHQVRASLAGEVGELAAVAPGSVVEEHEQLATLVPTGSVRIVADFPALAVGRIGPGQTAHMRLDGFPWTEYGMLPATVVEVAGESRDGTVRVECAVEAPEGAAVPLRHGMTGTVEVAVEQVSPYRLLFRSAGRLLGTASRAEARAGAAP